MRPQVHLNGLQNLSGLQERLKSQITQLYDINTHPSLEQRCSLMTAENNSNNSPSKWDDTPALSTISFDYVSYINDSINSSINNGINSQSPDSQSPDAQILGPESEIFQEIVSELTPEFLRYFYVSNLFISDDTVDFDDETVTAPPFPFTEDNARILQEYYIALKDLDFLIEASKEASPDFRFYYKGVKYNGANAPVEEHRAYYQQIKKKAVEVAMNCNKWISATEHQIYEMILLSGYYTKSIWEYNTSIGALYTIINHAEAQQKAKSHIDSVGVSFRNLCAELLDRTEVMTYIFDTMNVGNESRTRFAEFCSTEEINVSELCQTYVFIYNLIYDFSKKVRRHMMHNIVLPKVLESRETVA